MSLSIHTNALGNGTTLVSLVGSADRGMLAPLSEPLVAALDAADLVIVDLDLTVVPPDELRALVTEILSASGGRLTLVAKDTEILTAVTHAGIHDLVPVHHSVDDALQDALGPDAPGVAR